MKKTLLTTFALMCATLAASAYEYVFDMSKAAQTLQFNDRNKIVLSSDVNPESGKSATMTIMLQTIYDSAPVKMIDGKLFFPAAGAKIKIEVNGEGSRAVWLDRMPSENGNVIDIEWGPEMALVPDWQQMKGHTTNFFINGLSEGVFTSSVFWTKSAPVEGYHGLGPKVYYWTQETTLEDLTFADHNVKVQSHRIVDNLVGVQVINHPTGNGKLLICRSKNPISAAHKHAPQLGQEIYHDQNGDIPAWADPNTVQYAWVAIEGLPAPEDYLKKEISGVQGKYVADPYNIGAYHLNWYNPILRMASADAEKIKVEAEGVETQLNTYTVANMSEQGASKYFLMEPRLFEPCVIIDAMRCANEKILAPTEDALMPQGKSNFYAHDNIHGSGLLAGKDGNIWDFGAVWKDVDAEYNKIYGGGDNAWRTYNKVFRIDDALIVAIDKSQKTLTGYDYPLDVPNFEYDPNGEGKVAMALFGTANTKLQIEDYGDNDFAVADAVYFSRYDFKKDQNVYKNDLRVMVNNVGIDFTGIQDLVVSRWSYDKGTKIADVATLKYQREGVYKVEYNDAAKAGYGNALLFNGSNEYLGDNHFLNQNAEYNLKNSESPIIYLSDIFYSNVMDDSEANGKLEQYYVYMVEPGENTTRQDLKCVVNGVPVYKTDINVAGRSTYTKAMVDADTDNNLEADEQVKVYFTPNHANAVTAYNVLGGKPNNAGYGYALANIMSGDLDDVTPSTFMDHPNVIANSSNFVEYVPEAYTAYNDNTYGCYKQEVGDATISLKTGDLYESEATIEHEGQPVQKVYFCHLYLDTRLNLVKNDERYLVRVWRRVGNGPQVLLNGQDEFPEEYLTGDKHFDLDDHTYAELSTAYKQMDNMAKKDEGGSEDKELRLFEVNDLFVHPVIADDTPVTYTVKLYVQDNKVLNAAQQTAGAPRRAADHAKAYYVKIDEEQVMKSGHVITGIDGVGGDAATVASVRYVNVAGQVSDRPWSGVNMVVTTLTDGTVRTAKEIR